MPEEERWQRTWDVVARWLATGLGSGLSPVMPGTVGTLWGVPLAWLLAGWGDGGLLVGAAVLSAVGVPLCGRAAQLLGSGSTHNDPGCVVWDEIASFPLVFLGLDARQWGVLLVGFVLHRTLDIVKLPPARQAERLPSGWGIMADDIVAALQACVMLHGVVWLWPGLTT